jgi:hypothetical protein
MRLTFILANNKLTLLKLVDDDQRQEPRVALQYTQNTAHGPVYLKLPFSTNLQNIVHPDQTSGIVSDVQARSQCAHTYQQNRSNWYWRRHFLEIEAK